MQLSQMELEVLARIGLSYVLKSGGVIFPDNTPIPTRKIKNIKKIKRVAKAMKRSRKPMTKAQRKAVGIRMRAYWAKRRKAA